MILDIMKLISTLTQLWLLRFIFRHIEPICAVPNLCNHVYQSNMRFSERTLLIQSEDVRFRVAKHDSLSLVSAIVCIIDVFGVFPIVALPKAIIDCGFYGVPLIATVCSVQIYTAILLGRCWMIAESIDSSINTKSRYPYSALAEFTYGKTLGKLVTILVDITVFGGGIPNLIVASQNMQLLGLRLTSGDLNISFCIWILVLGTVLCPILWLGSPKDMKYLCLLSVCIVFLVFFLVNGSMIYSTTEDLPSSNSMVNKKSTWEYLLLAFGMVTFQFDIHPNILTIVVDMKEKIKISKAVMVSFLVTLCMFGVTCINGYLKFGKSLRPSILETLSTTMLLHFASVLVAVQLCLTSAISNNALYQHMEESLNISREFNHKRCILRTVLVILAIIIAESVPRFDIVMSLIGAALISPLVFILPPLFYLKILKIQDRRKEDLTFELFMKSADADGDILSVDTSFSDSIVQNPTKFNSFLRKQDKYLVSARSIEYFICVSIVLASLFSTILSTYLNIKDASSFESFSYPCIMNVTSAFVEI
ncbi:amino acid transporter AVT1I-like [Coccinella septempunctata]|uniref:amino acid transporter AVT1I-like n=1 Tax=Coccinella septempunctata TaxID=41139 RepID=UPI001D07D230|nr:amino acid transporter AVT1I-like [Coccinella septempunctata]